VGKRLFACPPILSNSAWATDRAVCPPYRATGLARYADIISERPAVQTAMQEEGLI
jgi:hypothetical protein